MYDSNLVHWLENFVTGIIQDSVDKSKIETVEKYWEIVASKDSKLRETYDFLSLIGIIPQKYWSFTVSQQQSIREYVQVFLQDTRSFESTLRFLCHVCAQFETDKKLETKQGQVLALNYWFLKSLWQEKFPSQYEQFESLKSEPKTEEESKPKIKCVECSSTDIISRGVDWQCRICGRRFVKIRRRKKNTDLT